VHGAEVLSEVDVLNARMEMKCTAAPLAITAHFWFLGKVAA
jgi:hypothetical protein